jgi:hypothetical protein
MPKFIEQWILFEHTEGKLAPQAKPFKSRELAEKARHKFPERERKRIGLGVIRIPER